MFKSLRPRLALLRLLPLGGRGPATLFVLVAALSMLVPAASALVVGELVARVTNAADGDAAVRAALGPIVVLGVLIVLGLASDIAGGPLRSWVGGRIDGHVLAMIRRVLIAPPEIDHLEDQSVRDVAGLATVMNSQFPVGAGVTSEVWILARYFGAFAGALVIAQFSIVVAVAAFGLMAWQRDVLRRHYSKSLTTGMAAAMGQIRAASWWSDHVAGTPGAKEMRLFGFQDWAVDQFAENAAARPAILRPVITSAFPVHLKTTVLTFLAGAVTLVSVGRAAASGDIDVQTLTTTMFGFTALFGQLAYMGQETYLVEAGVANLSKMHDLERQVAGVDHGRNGRDDDGEQAPNASVPEIVFDDVWFRYPGTDRDVLRGVSFTLDPGRSVAFVGANGAGKTTILKLLTRMYEPSGGRILIDGVELASIEPQEWRRRLAVIFQDFSHFELTARENVGFAALDGADVDVDCEAAAAGAGMSTMLADLPKRWDTVLSRSFTDGVELSGGQWQRVALARALFVARRGGQVLVLDEPTASLDASAEVELFDQLLDHAAGCTSLLVSHRFSTVRRASRILVLEDGVITEDGSHDELVARGARYAELYDLQASRFVAGERADASDEGSVP